MIRIKIRDIWRQLWKDLIGKDSHRGVTLTYSWLANQFGHFSLGFIPTILLFQYLKNTCSFPHPGLTSALIVSGAWLAFELYNFLGPLLSKRKSKYNLVFIPDTKYVFKPAWWNIAYDTFTDLCYFWFGAFSASLFLEPSKVAIYVLVIISLILLYSSYRWFLTKMYLQEAKYPFQFRLSQWAQEIDDVSKMKVLDFMHDLHSQKHLLLFGSNRSKKTELSVGIGSEMSIKYRPCKYATANKLVSLFFPPNKSNVDLELGDLWSWKNTSMLIIDDINPGGPIEDLMTASKFLELVDNYSEPHMINRTALTNKKVIWVLGQYDEDTGNGSSWVHMLKEIGAKDEELVQVVLS